MSEPYRLGKEFRKLYELLQGQSEAAGALCAGVLEVHPGQGVEVSSCVGKGTDDGDHALRYSRVEHWCEAAFSLVEDANSTEDDRRISAVTVVTPGLYHVSAGMRFGREDKIHGWGITRNSQRSGEKNVINMEQGFVLARALHRESSMDAGTYTTLTWTGLLQKDDVIRSLAEPQQFRQYQGVAVDRIGFLRAHFLMGG